MIFSFRLNLEHIYKGSFSMIDLVLHFIRISFENYFASLQLILWPFFPIHDLKGVQKKTFIIRFKPSKS